MQGILAILGSIFLGHGVPWILLVPGIPLPDLKPPLHGLDQPPGLQVPLTRTTPLPSWGLIPFCPTPLFTSITETSQNLQEFITQTLNSLWLWLDISWRGSDSHLAQLHKFFHSVELAKCSTYPTTTSFTPLLISYCNYICCFPGSPLKWYLRSFYMSAVDPRVQLCGCGRLHFPKTAISLYIPPHVLFVQ